MKFILNYAVINSILIRYHPSFVHYVHQKESGMLHSSSPSKHCQGPQPLRIITIAFPPILLFCFFCFHFILFMFLLSMFMLFQ